MKPIKIFNFLICILLFFNTTISVHATELNEYEEAALNRKDMIVESNLYENWPAGPKLGAESAILVEANTGATLYEKNIHEHLYPASVTKMLTALVAVDKCDRNEMVTFSSEAVNSIDWRTDANMGIHAGDSITMEQCLYGLLVGSANEAAYAIAEHICGSGNLKDFADLMNEKASELGCVDSHFVTPNGIHDNNHYTSAYDLALIATAFFDNELLCKMSSTSSYKIPQTATQPNPDMVVYAKSKLHAGKEYAYEGLVGTKTGYTDYARQTLVTCAERDGLKLISVILKEESPYQYTDTIDLLNYGFNNFYTLNVANNDDTYNIQSANSFSSGIDLFGCSVPLIEMHSDNYIVLPVGTEFSSTTSKVSFSDLGKNEIAKVNYYYNDIFIGSASIVPASLERAGYTFGTNISQLNDLNESDDKIVVINVLQVILIVIGISILLIIVFFLYSWIITNKRYKRRNVVSKNYEFNKEQVIYIDSTRKRHK